MEENQNPTDDEALVTLNEDQHAVTVKELTELVRGAHYALEQLKAGALTQQLAKTILYLTEAHLVKVCKLTGIQVESVAERDDRYAQLRAANHRVRQLEAQLGEAVTAANVKEALARFGRKVSHWWRVKGLGYASDISFTRYGPCVVTLSCMLSGDFSLTMSETPVSDKERRIQWHKYLEDQGFVLKQNRHREDQILDCDASKTALKNLVKRTFPSAEVVESKSHWGRGEEPALREARVYIYDLNEIDALPDSPDE